MRGMMRKLVCFRGKKAEVGIFLKCCTAGPPLSLQAGVSHDRGSPALHVRDVWLLPEWTHVHIWWL